MEELFLLPWTVLKWAVSLLIWILLFQAIFQSDTWYTVRDFLKDKLDEIRNYTNF